MNRVVLVRMSHTIRKLFARSELPVSVTSTMASASRGGLTSVAPQLNSTWAETPCDASHRLVMFTTSVAIRLAFQVFRPADRPVGRHGQHPTAPACGSPC